MAVAQKKWVEWQDYAEPVELDPIESYPIEPVELPEPMVQEPLPVSPSVRKHPSEKKGRRLTIGQSVLFLTAIVGLLAFLAAATIQITVVQGAEVQNLEREIADLKVRRNSLQMEVDQLRSVSRIESEALAMGMEKPVGTVYVASTLPSSKDNSLLEQRAALSAQVVVPPPHEETTVLDQVKEFAQLCTSFFASTQR